MTTTIEIKKWNDELDAEFWETGYYKNLTDFHRTFLAEQEDKAKTVAILQKISEIKDKQEYLNYVMDYIEEIIFARSPNVIQPYKDYLEGKATGKWKEWTDEDEERWMKRWNESIEGENNAN